MRLLQLDLNQMKTEEEVHQFLMNELHFPEYYGKNLDALYDMLTSELEENVCVELVRAADGETPMGAFGKRLEKVMEDAAQTMEEKDGKIYAVFADFVPLESQSAW